MAIAKSFDSFGVLMLSDCFCSIWIGLLYSKAGMDVMPGVPTPSKKAKNGRRNDKRPTSTVLGRPPTASIVGKRPKIIAADTTGK